MNIIEKMRGLIRRPDAAEWDASDPAGDPTAYDKDYAQEFPYDNTQFEKEAEDGD